MDRCGDLRRQMRVREVGLVFFCADTSVCSCQEDLWHLYRSVWAFLPHARFVAYCRCEDVIRVVSFLSVFPFFFRYLFLCRGFRADECLSLSALLSTPCSFSPSIMEKLQRDSRPTWEELRRLLKKKEESGNEYLEKYENEQFSSQLEVSDLPNRTKGKGQRKLDR